MRIPTKDFRGKSYQKYIVYVIRNARLVAYTNRYDWNNIIDDLVCKSSIFRTLNLLSSRQKSRICCR